MATRRHEEGSWLHVGCVRVLISHFIGNLQAGFWSGVATLRHEEGTWLHVGRVRVLISHFIGNLQAGFWSGVATLLHEEGTWLHVGRVRVLISHLIGTVGWILEWRGNTAARGGHVAPRRPRPRRVARRALWSQGGGPGPQVRLNKRRRHFKCRQ